MISLDHVSYTYPGAPRPVLQDLSLQIPAGQLCAVVGATEAGKSTLCYVLSGYIPHFFHGNLKGRIEVSGHLVPETPLAELVSEIGLVFQDPFSQITGGRLTVRGEVAFGLENLGLPREEILARIDQVLEEVGLLDLADRSPFSLSGGQQQRLAIAAILVMQPKVLVLDEPTSQLDPISRREFFAVLRNLTSAGIMTVVIAEHNLEWVAEFADRVIALADGRVVLDGSPQEVLSAAAMKTLGIGQTRYTMVAELARQRGLLDKIDPLPVTLGQALEFFQ